MAHGYQMEMMNGVDGPWPPKGIRRLFHDVWNGGGPLGIFQC